MLEDLVKFSQPMAARRKRYARADEAEIRNVMVPIALNLFLHRGYLGATVTDLTHAMGIARPSLYRFFGNKEGLFARALELHSERHLAYLKFAIDASTAREVVMRLLSAALASRESPSGPRGFIGLLSALPDEADAEGPRKIITEHRSRAIALLVERFRQARCEGDLAAGSCPQAAAYLLEFVVHGVSLHGCAAVTAADLNELIEIVIGGLKGDKMPGAAAEVADKHPC